MAWLIIFGIMFFGFIFLYFFSRVLVKRDYKKKAEAAIASKSNEEVESLIRRNHRLIRENAVNEYKRMGYNRDKFIEEIVKGKAIVGDTVDLIQETKAISKLYAKRNSNYKYEDAGDIAIETVDKYIADSNTLIEDYNKDLEKQLKKATAPSYVRKKEESVVKDAVIGGAIAGPAGAVVGAIHAADKNNKNRSKK